MTTEAARSFEDSAANGLLPIRLANEEVTIELLALGARVLSIETKDREGVRANIVLRYADLSGFLTDKASFGATVGRYANRIANGRFTIDGKTYRIPINDAPNALHGGPDGFGQKVWTARVLEHSVEFTYVSPSGEMGFPGTLTTRCVYTLRGRALEVDLYAETDATTVLNLTNHTYFNLSGVAVPDILGYRVQIEADSFVPVDAHQIPTGVLQSVENTPMDFRSLIELGKRIDTSGDEQLRIAGGYDQTWALRGVPGQLQDAALVEDPQSGRTIHVATTQPGLHLYTGNSLDGSTAGPEGQVHIRRSGLCLETQHYADSPNHPEFPSTTLKSGETFHEKTVFTFGVSE
jgi:aldose 1-epimerase